MCYQNCKHENYSGTCTVSSQQLKGCPKDLADEPDYIPIEWQEKIKEAL